EEAERADEDERGEDVDRLRPGAVTAVDDRPPERGARGDVAGVLQVEEGVRMPERGVVGPGQMPEEIGAEPERQRNRGPRQRANRGDAFGLVRQARRDAE